jgi:hypothetical protein
MQAEGQMAELQLEQDYPFGFVHARMMMPMVPFVSPR